MKILISHYLASENHPAAKMLFHVAAELSLRGHDVSYHRSAGDDSPTSSRGKSPCWKRFAWFGKAMAKNRTMRLRDEMAIRKFRPDIVLARQDAYCYSMPQACQRANVPLVTYVDAPVAYESRNYDTSGRWHPPGLVERIEQYGLKLSQGVIAVSNPSANLLRGYQLDTPIMVVPNGVDWHRFQIPHDSDLKRKLDINTPLVAGFVGSFRPFHGLSLLEGLINATKARRDLTWLLVGDGPGRAELEARTADPSRVRFLGQQPSQKIPELLHAMDLFVAPSPLTTAKYYFCPLKVLEAMAAEVPVLTGELGDIPNLLQHGREGILVKSTELTAWHQVLVNLIDDPGLRRNLATAASERARNYTWAHTARNVEESLGFAAQRAKTMTGSLVHHTSF